MSLKKVWEAIRRNKFLTISVTIILGVLIIVVSLLSISRDITLSGDVAPFEQKTFTFSYLGEPRDVIVKIYEDASIKANDSQSCTINASVVVVIGGTAPFNLSFYGVQWNSSRWCESTITFPIPDATILSTVLVVVQAKEDSVYCEIYCPQSDLHDWMEPILQILSFITSAWAIFTTWYVNRRKLPQKPAQSPPP